MATRKTKTKAAPKKAAPKAPPLPAKKAAAAKKTTPSKSGAAPKKTTARAKKAAPKKAAASRKSAVHEVVHWEIQAKDPAGLHRFYADAFDWEIDTNNALQYGMVSSKGKNGIDGGIGGGSGESRVVVYASVPSIPEALGRIESLGGKTVQARSDMGYVVIALYEDPEGNVMGLIEG
jgi:predicted enzyme related to lactoylglutathione lyase